MASGCRQQRKVRVVFSHVFHCKSVRDVARSPSQGMRHIHCTVGSMKHSKFDPLVERTALLSPVRARKTARANGGSCKNVPPTMGRGLTSARSGGESGVGIGEFDVGE